MMPLRTRMIEHAEEVHGFNVHRPEADYGVVADRHFRDHATSKSPVWEHSVTDLFLSIEEGDEDLPEPDLQAACDAWVLETAIERGLLSEADAIALQMEWAWVDRTEAV